MSETVERVARAIYESRNGPGCKPWSLLPSAHKAPYLADGKAALAAVEPDLQRLRAALEWIANVNQIERKTTVATDQAGNTYAIEMVDGVFATEARRALNAARK